jgi:hypothetical protein
MVMTTLAKWFFVPFAVPVSGVLVAPFGWFQDSRFIAGYFVICLVALIIWRCAARRSERSTRGFFRENSDDRSKQVLKNWVAVTFGASFAIQAVALLCLIPLSIGRSSTGCALAAGTIVWSGMVAFGTLDIIVHHVAIQLLREKHIRESSLHGPTSP